MLNPLQKKKKPRRWFFWNARNKFYFDKVQRPLKSIIGGALGFLVEYQRLNATQRVMQTAALFFCIAVRPCFTVFFFYLVFGPLLTARLVFHLQFYLNKVSIFYLKNKRAKHKQQQYLKGQIIFGIYIYKMKKKKKEMFINHWHKSVCSFSQHNQHSI